MDSRLSNVFDHAAFLRAIRDKSETWRYQGGFLGHAERVSVLAYNCYLLSYDREKTIELFDKQIEIEKFKGRHMRAKAYVLFIKPFRKENDDER